jgi:hypothetical protein
VSDREGVWRRFWLVSPIQISLPTKVSQCPGSLFWKDDSPFHFLDNTLIYIRRAGRLPLLRDDSLLWIL